MSGVRWMTSLALVAALSAAPGFAQSAQQPQPKEQRDSLVNGVLIGAAAGVAGALVFTKMSCGSISGDRECAMIAGPVGGLIMIPAGIVIGALIDRSVGNHKSVVVGPAVGKHKVGVVGRIRF